MYYDRGDLPIKMEYLTGGDKIAWTVSRSLVLMEKSTKEKGFSLIFTWVNFEVKVIWSKSINNLQVDIEKLDYSLYLPLFFDGLSETKHPHKTYARQGVLDLIAHGGDKIYPVIPQLIIPIKSEYLHTQEIESLLLFNQS